MASSWQKGVLVASNDKVGLRWHYKTCETHGQGKDSGSRNPRRGGEEKRPSELAKMAEDKTARNDFGDEISDISGSRWISSVPLYLYTSANPLPFNSEHQIRQNKTASRGILEIL
jgi:hypothetical protein